VIGSDPRFVLSRSDRRLGFYRNFERAMAMAPAEAGFIALCDQDDRWYPEKLATLREAIEGAQLAYSDQRLVDSDGAVLAETLWEGRDNNYTNLASLLVANTITGAAILMRREVAEIALPFPEMPGWQFHDHWLGLVALAAGDVAYVDRPLYDYVQHSRAILGHLAEPGGGGDEEPAPKRGIRHLARGVRSSLRAWRASYFCGYLRLAVQARTLLCRAGDAMAPEKRRALERFVRAERSPLALGWLFGRQIRRLAGRDDTLGAEAQLTRGVLWRWAIPVAAAGPRASRRLVPDASIPPCGPESFGQRRLRRWRARA
jgi:hypothetical protein